MAIRTVLVTVALLLSTPVYAHRGYGLVSASQFLYPGACLGVPYAVPVYYGYPYQLPYGLASPFAYRYRPSVTYVFVVRPPAVVQPPATIARPDTPKRPPTVVLRGAGRVGDELVAERVDGNIVRLTWRDDAERIQEVEFTIADPGQKVLASQTVRAAPFTALFDIAPDIAYVGVTLHYTDGVKSTTLLPYDRTRRRVEVEAPHTGLIVDASGLDLRRAMAPRILDEGGRVLYPDPEHLPDIDYLQERGLASYVTDVRAARRSGSQPLVVRAVAVGGPGRDDLIVSQETAEQILAANRRGHFLERWAVSILISPR